MRHVVVSCLIASLGGCGVEPISDGGSPTDKLVRFHNGSGPMCLDALEYVAVMRAEYPGLQIEEHLTTDAAALTRLEGLRAQYAQSEGVSASFGYLPIIFYGERAFSGFNDAVRGSLTALLQASC